MEYFKDEELSKLKAKHGKRVEKVRNLELKGILKSDSTKALSVNSNNGSSISLESGNSPDKSVYLRLNSKLQFEEPPKTPGLGIGGVVHKSPINVDDFHTVNSVMHRVSFVSGSLPGLRIVQSYYILSYYLNVVLFFRKRHKKY